MRTIAHISDIHFGREDPAIVEGLLQAVYKASPDLVVVSGDLTQRARKKQFLAARAFLDELPKVPQVVIPGNHDLSLTSMVDRAFKPFKRFKKYITADLQPYFEDDELAVAGVNTVRKSTVNDGRIKAAVVKVACEQLSGAAAGKARVLVTHHPMDLKLDDRKHTLVSRSAAAMQQFSACGVDLFLSGHLHSSRSIVTSSRYKLKQFSAVVVHAGTSVSTRRRGEPNAWNVIRVSEVGPASGRIEVQPMYWIAGRFQAMAPQVFGKGRDGWALLEGQ
jgi:3',5'-cyclic AMP phosphodiesterase CpdA